MSRKLFKFKKEDWGKFSSNFEKTEYFIKATSTEEFYLWKENEHWPDKKNKVLWEQISLGAWYQIGEVDKRPICVTFSWARLNNHLVCFYEGTSQLVDYAMIDEFRAKYFEKIPETNAMNFHQCLQYVRQEEDAIKYVIE